MLPTTARWTRLTSMVCTGADDRFRIGGDLYTYDSDDTFLDLDGADKIDMEMFETKIGVNLATTRDAANVQWCSMTTTASASSR